MCEDGCNLDNVCKDKNVTYLAFLLLQKHEPKTKLERQHVLESCKSHKMWAGEWENSLGSADVLLGVSVSTCAQE